MPRPKSTILSHLPLTLIMCLALQASARAAAPDSALARIQTGFEESQAQELRPLLAPDRKLYLAVPMIQKRAGFVGADQAYYLLRDFFKEHPTRSFKFATPAPKASGGEIHVRAEWRFEGAGADRDGVSLTFTLTEHDNGWVLSEIRLADS